MSIFSNLFGSATKKEEVSFNKINWKNLIDLGQLNEVVQQSTEKPVVIFKHSTRCIVSRTALKQFENEFDLENQVEIYYLDLIKYRTISNEIASRFGVSHQSPQVLLIKDGKSVYDVSHNAIDAVELKGKL